MKNSKHNPDSRERLRDLYPQLTETQLAEAEQRIRQYVAIVLRIHERVRHDPKAYAQFKRLTHPKM